MSHEFYRPMHVRAYRQRAGHVEYRQDPVRRGRGFWCAYGPQGTYLGAFSSKERAGYAMEQNALRLLYMPPPLPQFELPEEWPC